MSRKNHSYQICSRCVMDTSAPDIVFDANGVCNFCTEFLARYSSVIFEKEEERAKRRKVFIEKIKRAGKGNQYDCIIGISGGVDSAYAMHLAVQEGLRPLAVHMDNNWNSELAANNIKNIVTELNVDLYTHVINWPEYKGLMQAFFDADVLDIELLYDNALLGVNFTQARKYGIKYILSGGNSATEGMAMPKGWNWLKWDKRNIRALGKKGGVKLKTFPAVGFIDHILINFLYRTKWVTYLDFYDYQKDDALDLLESKYGYKRYPYKHYESIFTRFYQGYILPQKFQIDKRKLHLATLVMSDQMDREEALKLLENSPYPSEDELRRDKKYFLKKMGWNERDLANYISRSERKHDEYPSEVLLWGYMASFFKLIRPLWK